MARSKKRSRRKEAEAPGEQSKRQAAGEDRPLIKPNPPRANIPLVVLSGALLAGFLIYLAVIAWIATH